MAATWEVSNGTVIYKNEGTTATISGLNVQDTTDPVGSIEGISFSNGVFTVDSSVLPPSGTITATGATISIPAGSLFGAETTYAITGSGTTRTVQKTESAGWEDDDGDSTSFTRYDETVTNLATITLSYEAGSGLSYNKDTRTVTVTEAAFDKKGSDHSTISIETLDGDTITLSPSLGNIPTGQATVGDPELNDDNTAVVKESTAYYAAGQTSITYTPASTETLAEITGVQSGGTVTLNGKVVSVATNAVGTTDGNKTVTLTDTAGQGYSLALVGANNENKVGFGAIAATWNTDDGYKYMSAGTKEGWTISGNTITYTEAVNPTAGVTLSGIGLKEGLTVEQLNAGATVASTVVTVDSSLLNATPEAGQTVSVSAGYTIATTATKFDDEGTIALTALSEGSAKVQKTQTAGWKADDDTTTTSFTYKEEVVTDLATISGLKSDATSGISLSGKDVVLTADVLTEASSGALVNKTVDGEEQDYQLTLDNAVTHEAEQEDDSSVHLVVEGGTAEVKKDWKKYWTIESNEVKFHAAQEGKGAAVATVSGLDSTGATASTVTLDEDKTIKLQTNALSKTAAATIDSTGLGNGYAIELDGVVQTAQDVANTATLAVSDGTATVKRDQAEYWTLENNQVIYHAAQDGTGTLLAEVTGLAADTGVTLTSKTITLGKDAVGTAEINLSATGVTNGYTLALDTDNADESKRINDSSTKGNGTYSLATVTGGTATVKEDYAEYWTVTEGKKVTYTAKNDGAGTTAAEVTGLGDNASKSNVTLDGTTIKLQQDALKADTETSAQITEGKATYNLAFDGIVTAPNVNSGDPYLEVTGAAGSKGAVIKQGKTAGWTLETEGADANKKITYSTPEAEILATISGLGDDAEVGANISLSSTTITLKEDALKKSGSVTIDDTANKGYKFVLNGVSAPSAQEGTPRLDSVSGGTATYKRTPSDGWTLAQDEKSVTYSQPADVTVATITGLKSSAKKSQISLDTLTDVITLDNAALDTSNRTVTFGTNAKNYTLEIASNVPVPGTTISNYTVDSVTGGTAIINATKSHGWEVSGDSKTLTYKAAAPAPVAKVTGLADTATDSDVSINANTGVITLTKDALKSGGVEIIKENDANPAEYLNNFTLALDGATNNKLGYEDVQGSWTFKGTTANYFASTAEGWTLASNKRSVTYTAANSATENLKATITNLSKNLTLGDVTEGSKTYKVIGTGTGANFVAGATVEDGVITLNANVLGVTAGKVATLTNKDSNNPYKLALNNDDTADGFVLQESTFDNVWAYGTTTKYKNVELEYWTLDATNSKITYHPQVDKKTLATITGLKSTVTAADIDLATTADADDGKYAITLNKNALNKRNVNITSQQYKLAVNTTDENVKVVAPEMTNKAWSLNSAKTIATYKADVSEGYEAASDGSSITYTAQATGKTIAQVTGLNGNSKIEAKDNLIKIKGADDTYTDGITLDESTKVITLASGVLGTSNLKVTGTNYTLNVETDKPNNIYTDEDTEAKDGVNVWRLANASGNTATATYKKVKYAHYKPNDDDTEITYVPEANVANGTLATVTGLKRGLTVAQDGQSLNGTDASGNAVNDVLKFNDSTTTQIDLKEAALAPTNVTLTTTEDYTLALDSVTAPAKGTNLTWSLNGSTAELKGTLNAGWTLDTDEESATKNKKIIYTDTNAKYVFATLTGLKSGLTNAELNKGIEITDVAGSETITLDMSVLGKTDVTLVDKGFTGTEKVGYTLDLDSDVNQDSDAPIKVWDYKDGTATYKAKKEAYYTPDWQDENHVADAPKDKITYEGRKDVETLATLKGLKSGLTVVDDEIDGIHSEDDMNFTISTKVLGTSNVKFEGVKDGYTFALDTNAAPVQTGDTFWTVSGTTASYQFKSTAGYTQADDNEEIKYIAAKNDNTIAKITGLKDKLNATTVDNNITANANGTFTLYKALLGESDISVVDGGQSIIEKPLGGYKLTLSEDDFSGFTTDKTTVDKNATAWEKKGNDLVLRKYTTAGFSIVADNESTLKYSAEIMGESIAQVAGLKTNLKIGADKQITGIEFAKTDDQNWTIELKSAVLNAKDVTIKDLTPDNPDDNYEFSLSGVTAPKYSEAWALKNGTATLTGKLVAGYALSSASYVDYRPSQTVTTTISGLNSSATLAANKESISGIAFTRASDSAGTPVIGSVSSLDYLPIYGSFSLSANILNTKDIVLTNKSGGGKYTLELSGVSLVTAGGASWAKANNATTATWQTLTNKGYGKTSDTQYTYYSLSSGTPTVLATLKGLNASASVADLSNSIDVTAPTGSGSSAVAGVFTIKDSNVFARNTKTPLTIVGSGSYANSTFSFADVDSQFAVTTIANNDATWNYDNKKGTANLVAGTREGWSFKTTTKNKVTTTDYKTVVYTAAKPVTLATVTGLKAGLSLAADAQSLEYPNASDSSITNSSLIATFGVSSDGTLTDEATILLDAGVLDAKSVTVAAKKTGYKFTLEPDGDVYDPQKEDPYWTTDGKGKAYYKQDTTAGYKLNGTSTTLAYTKLTTETLATIGGLVTQKIAEADPAKIKVAVGATSAGVKLEQIEGFNVGGFSITTTTTKNSKGQDVVTETITPGTISLWKDEILSNKVTISSKYYTLAVGPEIKVTPGGSKWYFSNGTATYRDFENKGYVANTKGTAVEFKAETPGTTHVTLKGLAKKIGASAITADMINEDELLIANEDKTITLSEDIQGTSNITLVNRTITKAKAGTPAVYEEYKFDADSFIKPVTDDPVWSKVSKGTATLTQHTSAGFTLTDTTATNGQQVLKFSKDTTPIIATVKGLATNLAIAVAGDSAVTSGGLSVGEIYTTTTTGTGNQAVTTITGSDPVLSYNKDEKIITVEADALAKKNVTVSGSGNYTLALSSTGIRNKEEKDTAWILNGTTASYKDYIQDYYSLSGTDKAKTNNQAIAYTAAKDLTVYATVTGLNKTTTTSKDLNDNYVKANNNDVTKGGVLTLDNRQLGTSTVKVTTNLAKTGNVDGFTLALSDSTEEGKKVTVSSLTVNKTSDLKADNSGKAVLKGTLSKGFSADFGGKVLTYNSKESATVNIATITGLAKQATISKDSINNTDNTITLGTAQLSNKNVTLTMSRNDIDYNLALSGVSAPVKDMTSTAGAGTATAPNKTDALNKKLGWTAGSTATLKGYVSQAGYTLAGSSKAITYTAETLKTSKTTSGTTTYTYKDLSALATIKGLQSTVKPTSNENTITLTKSDVKGNLTLNGGTFAVNVTDVDNKAITGSAGADNITVGGTGLTVTGGKGDDYISLGTGNNTFVYSNGDGNDVIADFTTNHKLQIKSGTIAVGTSGEDVVVKVGTGSITLTGFNKNTIDIYNGKNVATTYAIPGRSSSNPLFADNNYSADAAQLSSIVNADLKSYTPYDFSSSFSLTKEKEEFTPALTYGKDK